MKRAGRALLLAAAVAALRTVPAAGQGSPLADARLAALPDSQRMAWQGYVARSRASERRERALMDAELHEAGIPRMSRAPFAAESFAVTPRMDAAWMAGDSARRIADIVLSFQTPTGGWSKHLDLTAHARRAGESWFSESDEWQWIGTIDQGSTTEEVRFLLRADSARRDERYRAAARRGVEYLLEARMPNGCWPQVYPLMGGYHDAVALADDATARVLALLDDVARSRSEVFDGGLRERAGAAHDAGLRCVIALQRQAVAPGAGWALFHDPLSGAPIAGRSYEPAALAPLETAGLLARLLAVPAPDSAVRDAAHAAAAWLAREGLAGWRYERFALAREASAPPLWPRLVSLDDGRPVFSNRDGVPRYDWNELTDRRTGYTWFGSAPLDVLERYAAWAARFPATGRFAALRVPTDSIATLPGRRTELDSGTMLGAARLARLASARRDEWERYVARSRELALRDRSAMQRELAASGRAAMRRAAWTHDFEGMARLPGAWFATDTARRVGESILSFQAPSGGWSKHVDFRAGVRLPGVGYSGESADWRFVPTIDNGSTTEELRFLSRADSVRRDARYADAFARGVEYLLEAQMPNGCWPQVFPLQGGYHDAVTFNDDAVLHVATLLREVAAGAHPLADSALRRRSAIAERRAVGCMLDAQVAVNGRRTVWGQQHDPLTLAPVGARSYELASLAGDESAGIARFLLAEPQPSPRVAAAVRAAADWFRANEIRGLTYEHYELRRVDGAGPLWGRMVDLRTGQPLFANRDGVPLRDYEKLTDRRRGYRWYTDAPLAFLRAYDRSPVARRVAGRDSPNPSSH